MSDNDKLDDKLGPPPVEPMSDVAWARVERGLWSRLDTGATNQLPVASRRRWLWVAVPTLAVAAVVTLLFATGLFGSRSEVPVVAIVDPVEPSRVVAGTAPSAVSFGDAHIDLAAQSAIVMSREGESPSVLLERGKATFAVAPRRDRAPFVVRAGDIVVRVVGTRFIVSRSDEQITVAVEHGLVDVQFRGQTHRIGAAQTWSSEAPDKVAMRTPEIDPTGMGGATDTNTADTTGTTRDNAAHTTTGTPDANADTTDHRESGAQDKNTGAGKHTGKYTGTNPNAGAGKTTGANADAGKSVGAGKATGTDKTIGTGKALATPDTRGTSPAVPNTRTGSAPGRTSGSADKTSGMDTRTGPQPTHTVTPGTLTAKETEATKYDRLVALERKDAAAALSGYLELSQGASKWAAVALYAAGRLAADRQDRRAATFLDIYLRRFPNGANANDARNLLARLKGNAP